MSRIFLIAIVAAISISGCNRFPDLTVQIAANLAPEAPECSVTPDQQVTVGIGRYDLGFPFEAGYSFTPRIESYLIDNSIEIQAVSQNFQVTTFDVTIKLPDNTIPVLSGGLPNPYRVPATSAVIPPSLVPGGVSSGTAYAEIIPPSYRPALLEILNGSGFTSVIADIRANGETSGGFAQQSPRYSWPIELCEGCLGRPCTEDEIPLEVCFPGQDSWNYCTSIIPSGT